MYLKKPWLGDYKTTSPFGMRKHPITGKEKLHNGIDKAMPEGTKLFAPINGICYIGNEPKGYGNYVLLNATTEQNTKIQLLFAHLSKILVKDGQSVIFNEEIALSGNTGASTGAHLHLGLAIYNFSQEQYLYVDPKNLIEV